MSIDYRCDECNAIITDGAVQRDIQNNNWSISIIIEGNTTLHNHLCKKCLLEILNQKTE